ncbi:MAG: hypothetical protein QW300_00300, partial [Desulfurococcaceae archaeon]
RKKASNRRRSHSILSEGCWRGRFLGSEKIGQPVDVYSQPDQTALKRVKSYMNCSRQASGIRAASVGFEEPKIMLKGEILGP